MDQQSFGQTNQTGVSGRIGPDDLVADRQCGACAVCCRVMLVDDPELQKPAGTHCHHWTPASGCGVYTSRSQSCRNWYCGWRLLPQLRADMRPDRSHVLVELTRQDLPAQSQREIGMKLTTLRGYRALTTRKMLAFIGSLVLAGYTVYLATLPEVGRSSGKALLNNFIATRDQLSDLKALKQCVRRCIRAAEAVPSQPVKFVGH